MEEIKPIAARQPIGFPVSARKFWIMQICTCQVYELYWAYKNFRNVDGKMNTPFFSGALALFLPVAFGGMIKSIKQTVINNGAEVTISGVALSWAFFLLTVLGRISGHYNYYASLAIGLVASIALFVVNQKVVMLNQQLRPEAVIDSKFSVWDYIGIALGSLFLLRNIIVLSQH